MQAATSETESKSLDLSICVHHYILRAPCPKGQGKGQGIRVCVKNLPKLHSEGFHSKCRVQEPKRPMHTPNPLEKGSDARGGRAWAAPVVAAVCGPRRPSQRAPSGGGHPVADRTGGRRPSSRRQPSGRRARRSVGRSRRPRRPARAADCWHRWGRGDAPANKAWRGQPTRGRLGRRGAQTHSIASRCGGCRVARIGDARRRPIASGSDFGRARETRRPPPARRWKLARLALSVWVGSVVTQTLPSPCDRSPWRPLAVRVSRRHRTSGVVLPTLPGLPS